MPVETDAKAAQDPASPPLVDPQGKPLDEHREGTDASNPDGAPAQSPSKLQPPSVTAIVIAVVVAIAGILLVLYAWQLPPFVTSVVATNDAYVQGRVTSLATKISGYVGEVFVEDFQTVRRRQPLVKIEDRRYRQIVAQAQGTLDASIANFDNAVQTIATNRANLLSAQASLAAKQAEQGRTAIDLTRISDLASRGSVSIRIRDQANSDARTAAANVLMARAAIRVAVESIKSAIVQREGFAATVESNVAALEQAKIDLSDTVIVAPRDGQVGAANVREGQYVAAGSQLIYLVPYGSWVIANFKETQTKNIRVGQPVSLEVDGLGGVMIAGRVQALSPATGSQFSVLKPDNASGNFTKVVQRIPIRIAVDGRDRQSARLRPGMSVIARIDTAGGSTP